MSLEHMPTPSDLWFEVRDNANLVLGAMLGAYLGLTISREGVPSGTYLELAMMLISAIIFVTALHASSDRLMRQLWLRGTFHFALAISSFLICFNLSKYIGIDAWIIASIFGVWIFVFFLGLLGNFSGWWISELVSRRIGEKND